MTYLNMKRICFVVIIFFLCFFSLASCKKNKYDSKSNSLDFEIKNTSVEEVKPKNHKWFYFSEKGYHEVKNPLLVPAKKALPWTEAIRISSANCNDIDLDKAFAIVNRLGVITFQGDNITLSTDVTLFNERTAGNLVFVDKKPVFSVYKSSFFNDTVDNPSYKEYNNLHLFLVYFDELAKISYPLINCNNLTKRNNSEVIDYFYDGNKWFCNIKSIEDSKISFNYLEFSTTESLVSLTPSKAEKSLDISDISVEDFRKKKELSNFNKAPQRIRILLSGFSDEIPFFLELKNSGGYSPRAFYNEVENTEQEELKSKGIISASWSAVLFEDGTLFIEGALPGKHILRGRKPIAIRLPKLPGGFVYSDFVIAGTTLFAAWEETGFYKTSRSGFISIDLDKTLYSKIR